MKRLRYWERFYNGPKDDLSGTQKDIVNEE